jgi:hypothetical protein
MSPGEWSSGGGERRRRPTPFCLSRPPDSSPNPDAERGGAASALPATPRAYP